MDFWSLVSQVFPEVACSPPALGFYGVVIVSWFALAARRRRWVHLLSEVDSLPEHQRLDFLRSGLSHADLPADVPPRSWLTHRSRRATASAIGVLAAALLLVTLAAAWKAVEIQRIARGRSVDELLASLSVHHAEGVEELSTWIEALRSPDAVPEVDVELTVLDAELADQLEALLDELTELDRRRMGALQSNDLLAFLELTYQLDAEGDAVAVLIDLVAERRRYFEDLRTVTVHPDPGLASLIRKRFADLGARTAHLEELDHDLARWVHISP